MAYKSYIRGLLTASILMIMIINGSAIFAGEKEKSEEEIGIRKESIYDESGVNPKGGDYSKEEPGKSTKIERSFENSPPLIPHDLSGMLPIAETNNMCLGCHMPDAATRASATPMPKSHFMDIETGKDLKGKLDGKRYNCMQCHVPQVNIPEPVENVFKGEFRHEQDKTRSSLLDSLNEGVKTE